LAGTKATNQRVYLLQNGSIRVMYGQHVYSNFAEAVQNIQIEAFTPFPNFINNAVLISIITLLSSATDLTDTTKAQFFFTSKFGETIGSAGGISTTTLQQAYNNSTNPEIVINATLDGLTIKNGTGNADNITRLLEGQTAANGVTSFIRADGYISGTTFQTNGFNANSNGITATTVSATTYYNLPLDIRTTGTTVLNGSVAFNRNDSMSAYTVSFSGVNINVISDDINKRLTFSASTGGGSSLPTLNQAQIFIGDTSNVAQARNVSGDIGLDFSGLTTIQPNVVTYNKMQTVSQNALLGSPNVSGGTVEEIPMIDAYITAGTAYTLLTTSTNWDIDGIYTGSTISGTYQGQSCYNGNYWFTAVDDNIWIRLIRG
jgi:hypothetical protein